MSDAVAAIVAQLPKLSPEERAELGHAVLRLLDPKAWRAELERRGYDVRSGAVNGVPAADVLARLAQGVPVTPIDCR